MPDDSTTAIGVVLADDHPLVLDGLEALFRFEPDFRVLARCRDGEEALERLVELEPDVAILDLLMPRRDGFEILEAVQNRGLDVRVVVLTAGLDDEQLLRVVRLGAKGVVLKEMAPELIVQAARSVHGGGYWLERGLGGRALQRLLQREDELTVTRKVLTARELDIVRCVAQGLRNRAIGEKLHITEGTVKIHLHNIFEKLGLESRLELARFAQRKGIE